MNICEEKPKPARSSCESRPQTLHRSSLLKSLASPLSVCSMSLKAPWFVTSARLGRDGGQRRPGTASFSFSPLKWGGSGRLLLVPSGEFDRSVNGRDCPSQQVVETRIIAQRIEKWMDLQQL